MSIIREIKVYVRRLTDLQDRPHNDLTDRDSSDCHPVSAINGLSEDLSNKVKKSGSITQIATRNHNDLFKRDISGAHPASAISGLITTVVPLIGTPNLFLTPGTTIYTAIAGGELSDSIENDMQCRMTKGTLKRLRAFIMNNSLNGDLIITIRKNKVDTLLTLTVGPGDTGSFTDDIHTVDLEQGDLVDYSAVVGGSIGDVGVTIIQCEFTSG